MWVSRPKADYTPTSRQEFHLPSQWPQMTPAANHDRLNRYEPGFAVCGVCTPGFGFVDVDTKNGGNIDQVEAWLADLGLTPWAKVLSPSGGAHFYITGSGDRHDYPGANVELWHRVGLAGVEVFGGRHFAYLPGTSRPKYGGEGYRVEWINEARISADASPLWVGLAKAKDAAEADRKTSRRFEFIESFKALPVSPDEGSKAYEQATVAGVVAELAAVEAGGRNAALNVAAMKLGAKTTLDLGAVVDALLPACEANGLVIDDGQAQCEATIRSGYKQGRLTPQATPANSTPNPLTQFVPLAPPPLGGGQDGDETPTSGYRVGVTWADQIKAEKTLWGWEPVKGEGRIPVKGLTLIAGREGTGKSSFALMLAAQLSRGTLPGEFYGKPSRVIYVAVEDSWETTLVPRLMAQDADLSKIGRVDIAAYTPEGEIPLELNLPDNMEMLRRMIEENDVKMVIVDPISSTINGKLDTHNERETRKALNPLNRLSIETDCMVLGVAHFSKAKGLDVSSLITGSGAFKNVARAIIGFAVSRDGSESVLSQEKNSNGRKDIPSFRYGIESVDIPTQTGQTNVGKFVLLGDTDKRVDDLLRDTDDDKDGGSKSAEAENWLRDHLTINGETQSNKVKQAAAKVGISERTLSRAAKSLNVAYTDKGYPRIRYWSPSWLTPIANAEEDFLDPSTKDRQ